MHTGHHGHHGAFTESNETQEFMEFPLILLLIRQEQVLSKSPMRSLGHYNHNISKITTTITYLRKNMTVNLWKHMQ